MKKIMMLIAAFVAFATLAGGITTNLVVYTDIRKPEGLYYDLHGTRLALTIRDGLIVECRDEGRYNLHNGLNERDALARAAQWRTARTNDLQRLKRRARPVRPGGVSK